METFIAITLLRLTNLYNKAGYTATLVARGWAGPVLEKVTRASGQARMLKKLKNAKKVKRGRTDQPTDGPTNQLTDIAGCRVA